MLRTPRTAHRHSTSHLWCKHAFARGPAALHAFLTHTVYICVLCSQYIGDLIAGMVAVMEGPHIGPFNVGNPNEFTMLELAKVVQEVVNPKAVIEFRENTADDPGRRRCVRVWVCVSVSSYARVLLAYTQGAYLTLPQALKEASSAQVIRSKVVISARRSCVMCLFALLVPSAGRTSPRSRRHSAGSPRCSSERVCSPWWLTSRSVWACKQHTASVCGVIKQD